MKRYVHTKLCTLTYTEALLRQKRPNCPLREEHGGGGIKWEFGTNIYTLPYIKQITNKDLLESTGNSDQYSVMS